MRSLRGRLSATLLALFLCVWIGLGLYAYSQFVRATAGSMDSGLDEVASAILLSMPSDIGRLSALSNLKLKEGARSAHAKLGQSVQVWNKARRQIVLRSTGSFATPLLPSFTDGFATVEHAGKAWRVYAISDSRGDIQVQVGRPQSQLVGELRGWLYYVLVASLVAFGVLGAALWLVVGWSLKPVVTIQTAITSREATDLAPLPDAKLPSEVLPLVDSFNRLLSRLHHALEAERRFLIEAAHELRTPMAVLLTHAQVARRARSIEEATPALEHLMLGAGRVSRLSQQLLDSARVERHAQQHVPVELAQIVDVMTRDFEGTAAQNGQTISLLAEPCLILGNVQELGILVRNLLDNAFRYAGQGKRVAVRCVREPLAVRFEVLDDGPGVPIGDRERIFDRFYRRPGNVEHGSGVGLALALKIAKLHHATISVGEGLDGGGFGIAVAFPPLDEAPA